MAIPPRSGNAEPGIVRVNPIGLVAQWVPDDGPLGDYAGGEFEQVKDVPPVERHLLYLFAFHQGREGAGLGFDDWRLRGYIHSLIDCADWRVASTRTAA